MSQSQQDAYSTEQAARRGQDRASRPSGSAAHFETLDGLRGVAAFAVVSLHMRDLIGGSLTPGGAFLAVDFFFCLSGFVICHAYQRRLQADLGLRKFAVLRIVRLAPLYLIGMILGLMAAILAATLGKGAVSTSAIDSLVGVLGILGLPAPAFRSSHALFPLNVPAWSLFFEIIANAAFAVVARYYTRNFLIPFLAFAAVSLIASAFFFGTMDGGNDWRTAVLGLARVAWGFPVGCLIYALWKKRFLATWHGSSWAVYPLLVLLLFIDVPPVFRVAFDLVATLLIFPFLILWAAHRTPVGIIAWIEREIGAMSYAIYIIHVPLGFLYAAVIARVFHLPAAQLAPLGGIVFLPMLLATAWILDRYIDAPVRQFLKATFLTRT